MFRRVMGIGLSLAIASVAQAGAVVELTATDLGTLVDVQFDPNDGSRANFNPIETNRVSPGDTFLVHVWMTSDLAYNARGMQVDHRGPLTTVPSAWLGQDVNNLNPDGLDGIPNFWFDYNNIGPGAANTRVGTFPVRGMWDSFHIGANITKSTGEYLDYSNLIGGDPAGPQPPSAIFQPSAPNANMFALPNGGMVHVGAMVVAVPQDAQEGDYTLDLLNASGATINDGARIDFGFGDAVDFNPTVWSSTGLGDDLIAYASGTSGPLSFTVIPEPATLILLGLGGLAALRRRARA